MDDYLRESLIQYVRDLYAPEDDALQHIQNEMIEHGMPQIQIQPEEGRLLQFLLAAISAKTVVEIGTLAGYSAVWIARALPKDGRLISLEYNEAHAEVARQAFEKAGVSNKVEVRIGVALDILPQLTAEGPYDAIFVDADKPPYPAYLEWALENVRSGGLIIGHNAFLHGYIIEPGDRNPADIEGVRTFNERLTQDDVVGTIIPMGDGLAVAIKK